MSRSNIKQIAKEETACSGPSIELCTILQILQEVDPFLQRRRLYLAEIRSVEQGINGVPAGVLATIVKEMTDPTPDLPQEVEVTEQPQDHSKDVEDLEGSALDWHLKGEILCWDNWWYISPKLLQKQLLRSSHDNPLMSHFRYFCTLKLAKRKYFWPKMSANIKHYIDTCSNCHWVKLVWHKPHRQLKPLPPAAFLFSEIMMDFIIDFPTCNWQSQVFNSILVLVNRYMKMTIYIPSRINWKAETIADVVTKTLLWKHGSSEAFILDRSSLFTAHYWKAFCTHLTIHCRYSTVFHSQTDRQTKQQNQTLEQYLRSYINYQ